MTDTHPIPDHYDAIWQAGERWPADASKEDAMKIETFLDSMPPDGVNMQIRWCNKLVFWGYNEFRDLDDDAEWDSRTCYVYIEGEWEAVLTQAILQKTSARERCDHCKRWVALGEDLFTLEGISHPDAESVAVCGKCFQAHPQDEDLPYWTDWLNKRKK